MLNFLSRVGRRLNEEPYPSTLISGTIDSAGERLRELGANEGQIEINGLPAIQTAYELRGSLIKVVQLSAHPSEPTGSHGKLEPCDYGATNPRHTAPFSEIDIRLRPDSPTRTALMQALIRQDKGDGGMERLVEGIKDNAYLRQTFNRDPSSGGVLADEAVEGKMKGFVESARIDRVGLFTFRPQRNRWGVLMGRPKGFPAQDGLRVNLNAYYSTSIINLWKVGHESPAQADMRAEVLRALAKVYPELFESTGN